MACATKECNKFILKEKCYENIFSTFVSKDASGVVTCRNPKGIYPETFKIAPIWFFEPERLTFKQKKVF